MNIRRIPATLCLTLVVLLCSPPAPEAREPFKPSSGNPEARQWLDRAWAALDREMTLKEIDEAIACLERALALDPENPEILAELADEYYQRGEQMPRGTEDEVRARAAWFGKGLKAAEASMKIRETAAAHYWSAVNLAAASEHQSVLKRASIFPRLNRHMNWIETHDRHYKYGGIARFWSKVVTRVPQVLVKMVGEDPRRVFAALEEAIQAEPRFLDNYLYQAEFFYHMGKKEEAVEVLDRLLRMDPEALPEERAYNRYAQKKARENRRAWTGRDTPQ